MWSKDQDQHHKEKIVTNALNRADASQIMLEDRRQALKAFNISGAKPLAVGTEAEIYIWEDNTLLKLYADSSRIAYFETLRSFYNNIDTSQSGLLIPKIHDITQHGNIIATIESRIDGVPFAKLLKGLNKVDHDQAENLFLDTVWKIKSFKVTKALKTYLLFDQELVSVVSQQSFEIFYARLLQNKIRKVSQFFEFGFPSFPQKAAALVSAIRHGHPAELSVVHGDFFPGNVLMDKKMAQANGIIDFGSFTLFGNFLIDISCAFGFYRMYDRDRINIRRQMLPKILHRLTNAEIPVFFQFLLAHAILTSDLYSSGSDPRDDGHFRWAAEIISDNSYWKQAL